MRLTIGEAADPRLADYVHLRDASLRRHLESEQGLFIAEGAKVIRRAIDAGYRPRSFLLAERWLAGLCDVLTRWPHAPVYVVSEDLAEQVTRSRYRRAPSTAFDTIGSGSSFAGLPRRPDGSTSLRVA